MKLNNRYWLLLILIIISGTVFGKKLLIKNTDRDTPVNPEVTVVKNGEAVAYFASGCFWCVEAVFESVKGVKKAYPGYSGGTKPNPTYQEVGAGLTDYAEAVEVIYDPKVVSFETLVRVFFGSQDPTTLNRQGPDIGKQYRSIAFYENPEQKKTIENVIKELNRTTYKGKITTQVEPFKKFYRAEAYHIDYVEKHPDNPYVRRVSIPRLNEFKAKFPQYLKK
ncbi:peptide-methionine (S)-S-oxide reductase MsrA [Aureivirga sp. CE67]|uniref:peptide-methionine (S)-S-oxide reductase MsrA n=1 Tax=Aureivirga sp. CE67 TaxID=1788983 RepID=UPI0018CA4D95|nr:peptide-methionine (S)-S-oxide reductase MsrA [Aureivirga sp. CE67]